MASDFMSQLETVLDRVNPNVSVTENGAVGYKTTGVKLLDLNFMLSSMRNWTGDEIWSKFLAAYNENPLIAIVWLFFARDIRGGCGERRVFRVIFQHFARENPDLAKKVLSLIPEYGRWDDLIDVLFSDAPCEVRDAAFSCIYSQLDRDLDNARARKPISLLAKWLPSINTSSANTRHKGEVIRNFLRWTPKQYRKTISRLRTYIDVTEKKMSANQWGEIDYKSVPSKAGMTYRDAFARHDGHRYDRYLMDVKRGKASMNSDALYPYEIVHAYMSPCFYDALSPFDETLELKWKNLSDTFTDGAKTLVVVDGSGSMSSTIGRTSLSCHDVARSLGIYFSERLGGAFHNSFITFSANPKLVRFDGAESLRSKLQILIDEDECSNTNIEKTFDLILRTAVENHMKQEDMPANILILSDLEFDRCTKCYEWGISMPGTFDESLFGEIARRFQSAGYKLPRLVFWNICSRSETIPVRSNEMGVALVSGFSQNIADMVMSGETDPWKLLTDRLHSDRYKPVWEAIS